MKKKKNISFYLLSLRFLLAVSITSLWACNSDFLTETPPGELLPEEITTTEHVEKLIIGAYQILNGQLDNSSNAMNSPASNWSFGDVMSDDAYKGGGGTGDQVQIHRMEMYQTDPTILDVERKWSVLYEGIYRVNTALRLLEHVDDFDQQHKQQRKGELYFLRGHYYFELKRLYNRIPYLDESIVDMDAFTVSNVLYTSEELWEKIGQDFLRASERLPLKQMEVGRPTQTAAIAYHAKVKLYQGKWEEVIHLTQQVLGSTYGLYADFEGLFLPENDNNKEIIFAVQHAIQDGSLHNYNGSVGDRLASPGGPFYPQYGFHRPSQNLINAFRTNEHGLPVLDTLDLRASDFVDPRLDHTVGRPGIPYRDLGILYHQSWARDEATYGPYGPKKRIVSAKSPYYSKTWPYVSALNYYVIRYAEVLLWRAEALVEQGDFNQAQVLVNQIRMRAKQSQYVKRLDQQGAAAPYYIEPYKNPWRTKEQAQKAVRLESRLELALEGERFFNLVRWGIASDVINNQYLPREKQKRNFLTNAHFQKGKNEYLPIPQRYIDGAGEIKIEQNPNY
ncbi:RagB/SusD family nutrient uptake outer membrane protein [Myroides sp. DF42-4-2]|uniref:RagB/SusD family nutrient uptake outer membrane protein n=1 Tax=unclassified Myroides TaxID=2642485 RepID=UPI00257567F2|nr:RagB/SusD family nutrient uptake outer membrane protein [Myroides sp. DF42-4-2]MDM1408706.1 RagB/SusD family nutrient uptake outer membrane protein [Myroides sp. DF42-4-2]